MLTDTLVDFVSVTLNKIETALIVKRSPDYALRSYYSESGLCAQCGAAPHRVVSAFCSDDCYDAFWPNM